MGHYLANKILFYLVRFADWQSHLNIVGQSRLLEGREEFERKYAWEPKRKREEMWNAEFGREM